MHSVHHPIIEELIAQQQNISKDSYFLSLYHPPHDTKAEDNEKAIRSLIIEAVRDDAKLIPYDQLPLKLSKFIVKILETNDEQKARGFAIFASFNPEVVNRSNAKDVQNHITFQLITLRRKPDVNVYIGETYDFTPLFFLEKTAIDAVVAEIESKTIKLFKLESYNLKFIQKWENPFMNLPDEKVINANSTGQTARGNGAVHTTGEFSVARRIALANYKFAEETLNDILKKIQKEHDWQQLVLFFSSDQTEHIEELKEKVLKLYPKIQPYIIRKNPSNEQDIVNFTRQAIRKQQDFEQISLAEDAVENRQNYVIGWDEVAAAARENRIGSLLIAPEAQHHGYIAERNLTFTSPSGDIESDRVKNITPWLTRAVIEAGGEVMPNEYIPQLTQEMIAGKLRW